VPVVDKTITKRRRVWGWMSAGIFLLLAFVWFLLSRPPALSENQPTFIALDPITLSITAPTRTPTPTPSSSPSFTPVPEKPTSTLTPTLSPTPGATPPPTNSATPTPTLIPTVLDFMVPAEQLRTETNLYIQAGQQVTIEYLSGSWAAGPSPTWPLVGPFGDSQVSAKVTFPVRDVRLMSGHSSMPPVITAVPNNSRLNGLF